MDDQTPFKMPPFHGAQHSHLLRRHRSGHRSLPREPALRITRHQKGLRRQGLRFQRQFPHTETDEYLRNAADRTWVGQPKAVEHRHPQICAIFQRDNLRRHF